MTVLVAVAALVASGCTVVPPEATDTAARTQPGATVTSDPVAMTSPTTAPTPSPDAEPGPTSFRPAEDPGPAEARIAVGDWPACLNPVTGCGDHTSLVSTVTTHTAARAMEVDAEGAVVASPLLVEAPTVDNGGLDTSGGSFRLTYRIAPGAVWSDGAPIACADFAFTWRAHLDTPGAAADGYDLVTAVECPAPDRAVVVFSRPYGQWFELFGGSSGVLLPAHAFESTDVTSAWQDEVTVSGGPWILESWSAGEAVLVPNDRYWHDERIPEIDRVVFVATASAQTQARLLAAGDVVAAAPATLEDLGPAISSGRVGVASGGDDAVEGLWPNQQGPDSGDVLSDPAVREALLRLLDRPALAAAGTGSSTGAVGCAGWPAVVGGWCDPADLDVGAPDLAAATTLLDAAGWTLPDGATCRRRDGRELRIDLDTTAGSPARERVAGLIVEMTAAAGVCWNVTFDDPDTLVDRIPASDLDMGLFATRVGWDGSTAALYGPPPTADNGFTGRNHSGCVDAACAELAAMAAAADREVDPDARREMVRAVGDRVRELVLWIPLYQHPVHTAWRTDAFEGPVGASTGLPYGGFADLYDWTLR